MTKYVLQISMCAKSLKKKYINIFNNLNEKKINSNKTEKRNGKNLFTFQHIFPI